jgi:hypothetical protein
MCHAFIDQTFKVFSGECKAVRLGEKQMNAVAYISFCSHILHFEDCGLDLARDTVTWFLLNMLAMKSSDWITF